MLCNENLLSALNLTITSAHCTRLPLCVILLLHFVKACSPLGYIRLYKPFIHTKSVCTLNYILSYTTVVRAELLHVGQF